MRIPDHFVRLIRLPPKVRGVTVPNDDGTFSVYINDLYGDEIRREALRHELEHLARDHFYTPDPVALQEAEAGGLAPAGRRIRLYRGTAELERYLRSIDALEKTIEELGKSW